MSSAHLLGGASAGVSRSVTMVTDLPILGSGSQGKGKEYSYHPRPCVSVSVCVCVCA